MWAIVENGVPAELLFRARSIRIGDTNYARDIFDHPAWDEDARRAIGIYPATFVNEAPHRFAPETEGTRTMELVGETVEVTRVFTDTPLADVKEVLKEEARDEASRRIIGIIPEYKRWNLLADGLELLSRKGSWVPKDQTAWDAGQALWQRVKAVRSAEVAYASLIDAVATVKAALAIELMWPE